MNKFFDVLTKIVLVMLAVFLGIILIDALILYTPISYNFNLGILAISVIVCIIGMIFLYKKIIPKLENKKWVPYVLMAVFGILCLILSYLTRLQPKWDMGSVLTIAKRYVTNGVPIDIFRYLYSYPHNLMLVLLYVSFFQILSIFNIYDFVTAVTMLNAIAMTGIVILLYQISVKMNGKKSGIFVLIISIFTTPLYLHSAIYYTDTISAFFVVASLYIFLLIQEQNDWKKTLPYQIIFAILLFLGLKMKMTVIILLIAIVIYYILSKRYKDIVLKLGVSIILIVTLSVCFNFIEGKILNNKRAVDVYKVPYEHWIMMGLEGKGSFSQDDLDYTMQYETYKEKQNADREKIKERIGKYTPISFLNHLNEKLKFAWTDGTYYSVPKVRNGVVEENLWNQMIIQDDGSVYKYIPQSMHVSMLILILIFVCNMIKEHKKYNENLILALCMLGILTFLLIWENRSRYIFTFVPIFMLLEAKAIEVLSNNINVLSLRIEKRKKNKIEKKG